MSEESKGSPIQEDAAREEGVQQEALNLQDEDDETEATTVVTPPPSSASQEKGSAAAKRPAKIKIFRKNKKTMEAKVDGRSGGGDENPRNQPNEEERKVVISKSVPTWKQAARSLSQEKCREEIKRKAVTVTPLQSSTGEAVSQEIINGRPSLPTLLDDEELSDPSTEAPANQDENPRNEANNESFLERVLRDVDTQIGLLNGIIDYHTTNGTYPFHDFKALDDFIDNWLQVDVPEDEQLLDVVVKLRDKYLKNMATMGVTADFADPRDQMAFDLANRIWGTAGSLPEYWKGLKLKDYYSS
jgi:hypothetical protein